MFIKIGVRDLSPAMVAWGPNRPRRARPRAGRRVAKPAADPGRPLLDAGSARGRPGLRAVPPDRRGRRGDLVGSPGFSSPPRRSSRRCSRSASTTRSARRRTDVGHRRRARRVGLLLGVDLSGTSAEALGGAAILLASLGYAVGAFIAKHGLAGAPRPASPPGSWSPRPSCWRRRRCSPPLDAPGAGPVAAVVALGVIGTGIAFAIFYGLMARVGYRRGPSSSPTSRRRSPSFTAPCSSMSRSRPRPSPAWR